jgi:carbonic anhydrase
MKLTTSLFLLISIIFINNAWSTHAATSDSPEKALAELQAGNARFVDGKLIHPKQDIKTREELVSGQKPSAVILSCSDSRVPPEVLFDQGLGQIFVVRTAGEVVDPVALGSIEYAVEHLGSKLIVVLGHESCGAVKASLEAGSKSSGSPNIDALVAKIKPNVEPYRSTAAYDKTLREPVKANVAAVAKELLRSSSLIKEAVEKGEVKIVEGLYSLKTGRVEFSK